MPNPPRQHTHLEDVNTFLDQSSALIDEIEGYVDWPGSDDAAEWHADGTHEHETDGYYYLNTARSRPRQVNQRSRRTAETYQVHYFPAPTVPTVEQLRATITWIESAIGPLADWQRDSIEHTLTEAIQGRRSYPPVYRQNLGLVEFPVPTDPNCTEWTYAEIRDLAAFRGFQIPSIRRPLAIDASDNNRDN